MYARTVADVSRRPVAGYVFAGLLLVWAGGQVTAETFPATPFNSLQVTYSIGGATCVGKPVDGGPFEGWERSLKGTLTGGTLRIAGTVTKSCTAEYGAHALVRVWAGSANESQGIYLTSKATAKKPELVTKPFDVSVAVPKDATSGGVSVRLSGNYSNGEVRFVSVAGSFIRGAGQHTPPEPAPLAKTPPPPERQPQNLRGNLLYATMDRGRARIVPAGGGPAIELKPGWKIGLRLGDQIVVGPGTKVPITFTDGSKFTVKANSSVEIMDEVIRLHTGGTITDWQKTGRSFEVWTTSSCLGVMGTIFATSVGQGGATAVAVKAGTVWFSDRAGKDRITVPAGQWAQRLPGQGVSQPAALSPQLAAAFFGEGDMIRPPIKVTVVMKPPVTGGSAVSVYVDGKPARFNPPPVLSGGTVYVPLRAGAEALGLEVKWHAADATAEVCTPRGSTFISKQEGLLVGGSLLLPLRKMGEATGAHVSWDGVSKTVKITRAGVAAPAPAPKPPPRPATTRSWLTSSTATAQMQILFDNGNSQPIRSGPAAPTVFSLIRKTRVLRICSYHWNGGQGAAPGQISVVGATGQKWGPWTAVGPQGERTRAVYWFCDPDVVLPAGRYTLADSAPATWSCNAASGNAGMAQVCGHREP